MITILPHHYSSDYPTYHPIYRQKNKPLTQTRRGLLNLAVPIVPGRYQPSIFGAVSLTAVFGMGTGVSPLLWPPEIF
jgi:hypothetical protein